MLDCFFHCDDDINKDDYGSRIVASGVSLGELLDGLDVIYFLSVDLYAGGDPFQTGTLFAGPDELSDFDFAFGTV